MTPDKKVEKAPFVPPFVRFVASAIPMVFDDSMSYYECLAALTQYLQHDIVDVINNNATVTEEYIQLTKDLQEYVDNYFANLDVQEEINNKLDQMAEDGTLQEIVGEYLNATAVWGFDTVADMKASTNLINGSFAQTLGFASKNDGGSALYKIRTKTESDVIDGASIIEMDDNTLVAELVISDCVRVSTFGAVGDGVTDDTDAIQKAFEYATVNNKPVSFERNKTYLVDQTRNHIAVNGGANVENSYCAIICKGSNLVIFGNGSTIKGQITQDQYDANTSTVGAVFNVYCNVKNDSEVGSPNNYLDAKHLGQRIEFNNLIIDGGGENITRTFRRWNTGIDHLPKARGINSIGQATLTIILNNTNIQNTIAEGMSGGAGNISVFVNGGKFTNVFPTPLNISGGIEIIDGAYIDNPMALELNPSYPLKTQIVRNCTIKSTYTDNDTATVVAGASGLLSTTPADNANVFMYNNTFDINYSGNTQIKTSIFSFRYLNNFHFKNNIIKITLGHASTSGYGGIFQLGNMNIKDISDNRVVITYPSQISTFPLYFLPSSPTFNYDYSHGNTFEVLNELDLSGTNAPAFPDLRLCKKEWNYLLHLTIPSGSNTLAYRIQYMDYVNRLIIASTTGNASFTGFDIQGYGTGSYQHLIDYDATATTNISKQGKTFLLEQVDPNANGEPLWIKSSSTTVANLKFDIKLYTDL